MAAVGKSTSSASSITGSSTQSKSDALSMQQFMQLLVSQLQNQDPLNPMSDSDFFAQMAQLGQVQGMDQLTQASQLQEAQGMFGKTVTAANGQSVVSGTVSQISLTSGVYTVGITDTTGKTTTVPVSNIESIQS